MVLVKRLVAVIHREMDSFYINMVDTYYIVQKCKRDGLYLAPRPSLVNVQGAGACLLVGANSPFRNIPILGWLL